MIENTDRWGNSRHKQVRQQRPVIVMGLPIVSTIEKLDPEFPFSEGAECRWQTFSIGKGVHMTQGHLTGRASYTVASGLEVEVQQDTDGAWKGFKKPTALTFSPLRTIMGSIAEPTQIDPVAHEIQGILEASTVLCLPAPKVEVTGMLSRWSLTTQREMGDLAWMAFGEVLDAWKIEFCQHIGFVSVYDIKMAIYETMTWDGLTIETGKGRVTFYGAQPLLLERLPDFKAIGERVSNIVLGDVPLSENLKYHYQHGQAELRKEYQRKTKAA